MLCGKTFSSFDHVELPDDVGVGRRPCTSRSGSPWLPLANPFDVGADDLAAVADVVDAVALDGRAWSRCPPPASR